MNKALSLILLGCCIVLIVLFTISQYNIRSLQEQLLKAKSDTIQVVETRVDTEWFEKPVPVYVRVVDSIPVPVPGPKDTMWVQLSREEKVYQDSTYRAVVSGYQPSLDSINVYHKVITIETTVTNSIPVKVPSRWGIGIQAGYGLTVQQNGIKGSSYLGVGLSYNLLSW